MVQSKKKLLKILMVHPHDCFSPNEPWTIRIMALAKEFVNLGHQVTLAYHPIDHFLIDPFMHEGIEIIPLSRKTSLSEFFKKCRMFKKSLQACDIAYVQKAFHYASVPLVMASYQTNTWFHYDWDDDEWSIYKSGGKYPSWVVGILLKTIERTLVYFADSISVSSDKLFKQVLKRRPHFKYLKKIWVGAFSHSPQLDKIEQIKQKYHLNDVISFVYVGQLHGGQYVEKIIRVFREIKDGGYKYKCLIIGEGHQKSYLESQVVLNGLQDDVIFTGSISKPVLFDCILSCNVALAAFEKNDITKSKSPLKIAEYVSLEMPIISDNVGEVEAMLGGAGLLVNPCNLSDLKNAIQSVIINPSILSALKEKITLRKNELTWKKSAQNMLRLWEDVS